MNRSLRILQPAFLFRCEFCPATHVRGLFFVRLVLICTLTSEPNVDQRHGGPVLLRHCCRTGKIYYDFRSGSTTGRKKFQKEKSAPRTAERR